MPRADTLPNRPAFPTCTHPMHAPPPSQGGLNSSKLSVDPRTLKDAVASIMEELGVGKGGVVLREEFL